MISKYIIILLIFFTIVFIISEIWNLLDKYTLSFSIKSLSIKDLKYILEYRGIDYKGVFEKTELINLIKATGDVNYWELKSAKRYVENEGKCNSTSISIIPNEDLFNELVEDSKDSAWILMTKSSAYFSDIYDPNLADMRCHIQSIYAKFGVNMAVLDCKHLYNLCWDRGFHRSPFVLVLPRGRVKIKDSVDFFVFPYLTDMSNKTAEEVKGLVVEWLRKKLAHRVNSDVQDQKVPSKFFPVHFISVYSNKSELNKMPPTSISALSVKFTGRIHFWSTKLDNIPSRFRHLISKKFPNWQPPGHFFIGENGLIYQYGEKQGQSINYDSLQLFFRDLCPNSNDIFIWNLLIVNLLISFQIAMQTGSIALRLGYLVWYFLIYNILYCSIFLSVLSSLNYSQIFDGVLKFVSFTWQKIALIEFFDHIRYLQLSNKLTIFQCCVVWLLMILILVFTRQCQQQSDSEQLDDLLLTENISNNRTLEPWDPEAGQQIAYLSSLGNFNLILQQQPPLYLSRLFSWSFQAPKKLASRLTKKCKDNSKVKTTIREFCEKNKIDLFDESDFSSDFSSGDNLNHSSCVNGKDSEKDELQWPKGYIYTKKCCICLVRFQQDVMLCGLPCGHAFHDVCIKKWLIDMVKDDCPQCRWPVYKDKP